MIRGPLVAARAPLLARMSEEASARYMVPKAEAVDALDLATSGWGLSWRYSHNGVRLESPEVGAA